MSQRNHLNNQAVACFIDDDLIRDPVFFQTIREPVTANGQVYELETLYQWVMLQNTNSCPKTRQEIKEVFLVPAIKATIDGHAELQDNRHPPYTQSKKIMLAELNKKLECLYAAVHGSRDQSVTDTVLKALGTGVVVSSIPYLFYQLSHHISGESDATQVSDIQHFLKSACAPLLLLIPSTIDFTVRKITHNRYSLFSSFAMFSDASRAFISDLQDELLYDRDSYHPETDAFRSQV